MPVKLYPSSQVVAVNFATGASTSVNRDPNFLAHGALMFIAWGVLLPLGVLFARFTKGVPTQPVRACGCARLYRC